MAMVAIPNLVASIFLDALVGTRECVAMPSLISRSARLDDPAEARGRAGIEISPERGILGAS
jgi:hypothetical protein